jgi:glycosyltransferase involved in cell wall biosynthesis
MNIVVNTRVLLKNKLDGIGWFTYETLKRITNERYNDKFYFIFDRPFSEEFIFSGNIEPIVIRPAARHPLLWYYWFEWQLPKYMQSIKTDVFVSPDGYISLNSRVKSLAVIHDINFVHFPNDFPISSKLFYNHYFPKYAHKADRLATVSEFSKSDIVENFKIDPAKIDVVYNGFNEVYKPVCQTKRNEIKNQYTGGEDFFIFIGSMHPRKNLANMLLAYDKFRKMNSARLKFLLVGEYMFKTDDIKKALISMQFSSDVIFLGRLEPGLLKDILGSAFALVFVSKFEGFGIPVLEALKCNTAAILSNVSSLPEIAMDAAIYAEPYSIDSICNAMLRMVQEAGLKEKLIENGQGVITKYSWKKTSDLLWQSICKTIQLNA